MSSASMKQCPLCGAWFEPCNTCNGKLWRAVVCSPEHFTPYQSIIQYSRGKETKEQAAEILRLFEDNYGIPNYTDNIMPLVKEIKADDIKPYEETDGGVLTADGEGLPRKKRRHIRE